MSLPYESATSGKNAITEIEKILRRFGCQAFGHMLDYEKGELVVQFKYRDTPVTIKASMHGYATAWLKEHPYSYRVKTSKASHEKRAKEIAAIAVYSIIRDWIKGQVTAIECGILSFQGAFLGQIMLPNGDTVLERISNDGLLRIEAPRDGVR